MSNPKHSSKTALWYTPLWIIEKVHTLLGDIDFDPASDAFGNSRIKAKTYWTEGALEREWPTVNTVFLNPPGGKVGKQSQAALFWAKFMQEWSAGKFERAVFIGFSIEIMQTAQNVCAVPPQAFPFCVTQNRFGFDKPDGNTGTDPSHTSMITYVPSSFEDVEKFKNVFEDVGHVVTHVSKPF